MKKTDFIEIENLLFPKDYLFSFKDPNGGLWIQKIPDEDSSYRIGVSSLVAVKLEKLVKCNLIDLYLHKDQLIDNEIFLFLKGFNYEINLFAPFNAKIIRFNPLIETCSEETPVVLTQESVYENHWILEVEIEGSLLDSGAWFTAEDKKLAKMINIIIKGDKKLRDRCCPNLFDSDVVRRLQKNK